MKILLSLTLVTVSLGCSPTNSTVQANAGANANTNQLIADSNKSGGQRTTLNGYGVSLMPPGGWSKDDGIEPEPGEFTWYGPDKAELSIIVSFHKPEYGNRSIEEEIDSFYRDHKEGGSKDVRLLEVDGVRGVHFTYDDQVWKVRDGRPEEESYRFIRWSAQRMYRGKRQIIFVTLSAPVKSVSKHRDTLYSILNSIKFLHE